MYKSIDPHGTYKLLIILSDKKIDWPIALPVKGTRLKVTTVVNPGQSKNALSWIDVTEEGMVKVSESPMHSPKASFPIEVTEEGIV